MEDADWLSGDHRPEGIYVMAGAGVEPGAGEEISLVDLAPIILGRLGIEAGAGMTEAASSEPVFSEAEEREVEERLRGLGYLE